MISVLLFSALPPAVEFDARGAYSPLPDAVNRTGGILYSSVSI